jgi:pre-rRNA-processing protein TSR1
MSKKEDTKQFSHRASNGKQTHKPFKGKSNSSSSKRKGKLSIALKSLSHNNESTLSKQERKNQTKVKQLVQKEQLTQIKDMFSSQNGPARRIFCVPLTKNADPSRIPKVFLNGQSKGYVYSQLSKQRLHFDFVDTRDIGLILLKASAADTVIFVVSGLDSDGIDEFGAACFTAIRSQGLSSSIAYIQDLSSLPSPKDQKCLRQEWTDLFKKELATVHSRIFTDLDNNDNLVRVLSSIHLNGISWREPRSYLHVESLEQVSDDTIKIGGYSRGPKSFDPSGFVHLVGFGDFPVQQIDILQKDQKITCIYRTQESQQVEEIEMDTDTSGDISIEKEEDNQIVPISTKATKKSASSLPSGTSDYQSAWLSENETEQENDVENSTTSHKEISFAMDIEEEDDNCDLEEHKRRRTESKKRFPDEFDELDETISARERLSSYRGVKSLRTSEWDLSDNLPKEYGGVFQFQNYRHSRKRALNFSPDFESETSGKWIQLSIKVNDPSVLKNFIQSPSPLVVGLLKHEEKKTVLHMSISRNNSILESPLKSKDQLYIACGFRRFSTQPIFNTHNPTFRLQKMLRFLPEDGQTYVATSYLPVMYDPCPVLYFHPSNFSLIATGNILECNPNRVVLKRITLTGLPFKIHKKGAVIRFMFFNPVDIAWFKPVELETRDGRRGLIKESLGTHGYMKCTFDRQINSQDVVFMHLYKRIFPKWTTYSI